MRQVGAELLILGLAPVLIVAISLYGVIGGFKIAEAFVPVFAIGLIFGATAGGMYGFVLLFRAIRWLTSVSYPSDRSLRMLGRASGRLLR